jgi:hypothetical protein
MLPLQMYAPQPCVVCAEHVPIPLQVCGLFSVVGLSHVGPTHCVPFVYFWQPPIPSQSPSVPQDMAPWVAHVDIVFGVAPAPSDPQMPFISPVCAFEHAWQPLPHALLQQKPSTQLPIWHSWLLVHAALTGSLARQEPLLPVQ